MASIMLRENRQQAESGWLGDGANDFRPDLRCSKWSSGALPDVLNSARKESKFCGGCDAIKGCHLKPIVRYFVVLIPSLFQFVTASAAFIAPEKSLLHYFQ